MIEIAIAQSGRDQADTFLDRLRKNRGLQRNEHQKICKLASLARCCDHLVSSTLMTKYVTVSPSASTIWCGMEAGMWTTSPAFNSWRDPPFTDAPSVSPGP